MYLSLQPLNCPITGFMALDVRRHPLEFASPILYQNRTPEEYDAMTKDVLMKWMTMAATHVKELVGTFLNYQTDHKRSQKKDQMEMHWFKVGSGGSGIMEGVAALIDEYFGTYETFLKHLDYAMTNSTQARANIHTGRDYQTSMKNLWRVCNEMVCAFPECVVKYYHTPWPNERPKNSWYKPHLCLVCSQPNLNRLVNVQSSICADASCPRTVSRGNAGDHCCRACKNGDRDLEGNIKHDPQCQHIRAWITRYGITCVTVDVKWRITMMEENVRKGLRLPYDKNIVGLKLGQVNKWSRIMTSIFDPDQGAYTLKTKKSRETRLYSNPDYRECKFAIGKRNDDGTRAVTAGEDYPILSPDQNRVADTSSDSSSSDSENLVLAPVIEGTPAPGYTTIPLTSLFPVLRFQYKED